MPNEVTSKGQLWGGVCNRTACNNFKAVWWNTSTRAYYCTPCARAINEGAEPPICVLHKSADQPKEDYQPQRTVYERLYPNPNPSDADFDETSPLSQLYFKHLSAMTAEGLREKSDIAWQLAARDHKIEQLRAALKLARPELFALYFQLTHKRLEHQDPNGPNGSVKRASDAIDAAIAALQASNPQTEGQAR